MDLTLYIQYYRCKTADRQQEIDECLRRNLNHPGVTKVVLFKESDAPPLPKASVPWEVVESNKRITYAEWLHWVKRQGSGIALLLNADIYLDADLEHLTATFDTPETFLALTRYTPGHTGFHLNHYPHWTQDVWGVRADGELPEIMLDSCSFALVFPGCDNRFAYVMWSYGFRVRHSCYHVRSVYVHASTARAYYKTSDWLYGSVSYLHPSPKPDEDAEPEFMRWTLSEQRPSEVLMNQHAIEQVVHQLLYAEREVAQRFLDQQKFTVLAWSDGALGSAYLEGDLRRCAIEDTVILPMPTLPNQEVEPQPARPTMLDRYFLAQNKQSSFCHQVEHDSHKEERSILGSTLTTQERQHATSNPEDPSHLNTYIKSNARAPSNRIPPNTPSPLKDVKYKRNARSESQHPVKTLINLIIDKKPTWNKTIHHFCHSSSQHRRSIQKFSSHVAKQCLLYTRRSLQSRHSATLKLPPNQPYRSTQY